MKHFGEARDAAAAVARDPALLARCKHLCLLWDVRGRLRVLVKPADEDDAANLSAEIDARMRTAAGRFWSGEQWLWRRKLDAAEQRVYQIAWDKAEPMVNDARLADTCRVLDRHLSKQTWFGKPQKPPWPLNEQTPPILSFFSFKGGVGRTTTLVSIALQLARAGRRVCVVDLDLEAPGVGTLLAPAEGPARFGVVDFLLESTVPGQGDIALDDFLHVYEDQRAIGQGPPITVVPAGRLDEDYLEKLARIDYQALLMPDAPEPPLRALLERLRRERRADYILIDSRAGLHDIGGLALNGIAHLDVIFATDSEQSWQGLPIVIGHLGRRRVLRRLSQQRCALVHAMAPPVTHQDRESQVEEFRARAYEELFVRYFYDAEPEQGWPSPMPEDVSPVPAIDAEDQPHHALPVGLKSELQGAWTPANAASLLLEGDFVALFTALLARLGRSKP